MSTSSTPRIVLALASHAIYLAAALAVWVALSEPALAACATAVNTPVPIECPIGDPTQCECLKFVEASCAPAGRILNAFLERGACPKFGTPVSPPRPRLATGGLYQQFERGEIAAYDTWTRDAGASTPGFELSAYWEGKDIKVQWGSTAPYNYDFFVLRWDLDDHGEAVEKQHKDAPQQLDVPISGNRGEASFAAGEGGYVIYVEGCNDEDVLIFEDTECAQGWSHPVYVDRLPRLVPPTPIAAQPSPVIPAGIVDVPDIVALNSGQQTLIREALCKDSLLVSGGHHDREIRPTATLARLQSAASQQSCNGRPPSQLRAEVNGAILDAQVNSVPGTDLGEGAAIALGIGVGVLAGMGVAAALTSFLGSLATGVGGLIGLAATVIGGIVGGLVGESEYVAGDYDMQLGGMLQMIHRYPSEIDPEARTALLDRLLTVRGGADRRLEIVYLFYWPTPIPETENHIWMTESARYLTNNLLARRYRDAGQPVPKEYDNDVNGMTKWVLDGLRAFLIEDFYELNSRPYATHILGAIQNLYEFATYEAVCSQVASPGAPAQPTSCDVRRAARNALDFLAAKFAVSSNELRRSVPFRRQPPFRTYPRLLTQGGDDLTWHYLGHTGGSDFLRDERHSRLMAFATGELQSVYQSRYAPPVIVTDLIRSSASGVSFPLQRFRSTARDGDVLEIYYRHPLYLLSAGGRYDEGSGLASLTSTEDAWALATTLMPTVQGEDTRDFVRIEGHPRDELRNNTCVAPGFACGMNPALPIGLPQGCTKRDGNWTFVNFKEPAPDCPLLGFFVAFYRADCKESACLLAGADLSVGSGAPKATWGFFHVSTYGDGFDNFIDSVMMLNKSWDFRFDAMNVFKMPDGGRVTFILDVDGSEWAIVDYDIGAGPIQPERRMDKWPVAQGDIVNAPRAGCITIENARLKQTLILDHTDVRKPRRTIITSGRRDCSCPLADACISPRSD